MICQMGLQDESFSCSLRGADAQARQRWWFEGNYGAYIDDLKRRKGADADQPHRIKYKPLVRK